MTHLATAIHERSDAWAWWQSRRLAFNAALAAAGWAAFLLTVWMQQAAGEPMWENWRQGLSLTIALSCGYLVYTAGANVAFLVGPWTERWVAPADLDRYRSVAWRMGLLGSCALPFLFPTMAGAMLISPD